MSNRHREAKCRKRLALARKKHADMLRRKALPLRKVFVSEHGRDQMGRFVMKRRVPLYKKSTKPRRERMLSRLQKKSTRRRMLITLLMGGVIVVVLALVGYILLLRGGRL